MAPLDRVRSLADGLGPATIVGIVQVILGAILWTRYDADPSQAHAAVRAIADGNLGPVRSLHSVLASALVVLVLVNLARAWTRALPPTPREWAARVALAALLLVAFQTGGILAWDQRGWESYQHLMSAAGIEAVSPEGARLALVAAAHVAAIPLALGLLALVHPPWRQRLLESRSLLQRNDVPAGIVLVSATLLAFVFPRPLGPAPIAGVSLTRPEWPFLWLAPLQEWMGTSGLRLGLLVVIALAAAAPFAARDWSPRRRTVALWTFATVFVVLAILGALT